ncbi:CHASE3 domain-containing protein [Caulobacter sp. B11]|uniref:CHASE3 domain-containing protein n=1 Tax=Caulobacter sp. B11 TaxID=2048899 RepID=UPI0013747B20
MAVFAVMLATIMLMGGALYANKLSLEASVNRTETAYQSLRAADQAAFRLTRQENSLRGFLLSGDEYYVQRLEEAHKPKFLAALNDIRKLANGDEAGLARIAAVEAAYAAYRTQAIEPAESRDPLTRPQAVELVKHDGVADKAVEPVENAIDDSEAVVAAEAPPRSRLPPFRP